MNVGFLRKVMRKAQPVLSVNLHERRCAWVYGMATRRGHIHMNAVLDHGEVLSNAHLFGNGGRLSQAGLAALLEAVLADLKPRFKPPEGLVFVLPSKHCFMGNLTVGLEDGDEDVDFQVQDMLQDVAGDDAEPMTYDWQDKSQAVAFGERHLAVAAVHAVQLQVINQVCKARGIPCWGLTLDHVSAINGYLRALPQGAGDTTSRYLLYGELSPEAVRLAVFVEGVPFSEHWERSVEGFSVIQAISALESLVNSWSRGVPELESRGIQLLLGGELMEHKSTEQIVRRSQLLGSWYTSVTPLAPLAQGWHRVVAAYGAVEGLPCD